MSTLGALFYTYFLPPLFLLILANFLFSKQVKVLAIHKMSFAKTEKSSEVQDTTVEHESDSTSILKELNTHFVLDDSGLLSFNHLSPRKPKNWTTKVKLFHTILFGLTTFAAQLNSTAMATSILPELIKKDFGVGREISLLPTTLYLLGIAFGPMVFAPLSEVYGRKIGVLIPFFTSAVFSFVVASTSELSGVMIFRFLSGFCAGAPIVSAGGVLADIWNPTQRGAALAVYACFVSSGPSFGPTISSLLMHSIDKPSAWRIPQYFSGLLTVFLFVVCELTLSETYEPVILAREAKSMRIATDRWQIHCKHDSWKLDARELVLVHFIRPFAMLITPIVLVIAIFASYVYGIFYLIITTMPEAFTMTRGWQGTVATLPNISLFLGVITGCFLNMAWANHYGKMIKLNNGQPVPEQRFPLLMYVGWMMPVGIFIFGWTSSASIHWIVPCIGILLIGCGFITIFQGCLNYLVDAYTKYSASVIAANTFLRSVFAASFPLFSKQLFDNLGVHWGASLIGFIALGMIPIPFLFYKWGKDIRLRSKFTN